MQVKAGVVIPASGMDQAAIHCIESVKQSADFCGAQLQVYTEYGEGAVLRYNKSAALNRLINRAIEDGCNVIATLDADCIVPPMYAHGVHEAGHPLIDRVCFHVRESADNSLRFFGVDTPFNDGRTQPASVLRHKKSVFGNAIWACRVEALHDQRFDERLIGRGFEDIEFTCRVVKAVGGVLLWRGKVFPDGPHTIVHQTHEPRGWAGEISKAQHDALNKAMQEVYL